MNPAFEDNLFWNNFFEELLSWKGTPYRHLQCTKGIGADCTLFLSDVFLKIGLFYRSTMPKFYPKNWFLHTKEDLVRKNLEESFSSDMKKGYKWVYEKYEKEEDLIRGDIVLFILRPSINIAHHTGVYLGKGKFFQGTVKRKFDVEDFGKWKKCCVAYYRLYRLEK